MSLSQKIEQLRKQPAHVRERILLGCLAVITPIIFVIWFATFQWSSNDSSVSVFKNLGNSFSSLADSFPSFSKPSVNDEVAAPPDSAENDVTSETEPTTQE